MNARFFVFPALGLWAAGCVTLFGWNIHAPGTLSAGFFDDVPRIEQRIALYLPDGLADYVVKDRGGRFADPQTYYVGESFVPMCVEAFQHGFSEFILMETEPTPEIMAYYGIPYLVAIRPRDFGNRVTLKGQAVGLTTDVFVFDSSLELKAAFETNGSSDALRVFAKRGGPEVNLNAAIENNLRSTVVSLEDWMGETRT